MNLLLIHCRLHKLKIAMQFLIAVHEGREQAPHPTPSPRKRGEGVKDSEGLPDANGSFRVGQIGVRQREDDPERPEFGHYRGREGGWTAH